MKTETEKLGRDPAYPFIEMAETEYGSKYEIVTKGMSKRFYAACAAMQGILANPNANPRLDEHYMNIAEDAFRAADELLKQENQ